MRTRRIREFHSSNPKIDFFVDGVYRNSTNYFTHCKDAREFFCTCILRGEERLKAHSKKSFVIARKAVAR